MWLLSRSGQQKKGGSFTLKKLPPGIRNGWLCYWLAICFVGACGCALAWLYCAVLCPLMCCHDPVGVVRFYAALFCAFGHRNGTQFIVTTSRLCFSVCPSVINVLILFGFFLLSYRRGIPRSPAFPKNVRYSGDRGRSPLQRSCICVNTVIDILAYYAIIR